MKSFLRLLAVLCLASVAFAQSDEVAPNENLVAEGIPKIPASLAESLGQYTEFRTAGFSSWHPQRREMLIVTRFADTAQVHDVKAPGAARTQLTFFPDGVRSGIAFEPVKGDSFIFLKDIGGGEFYQIYRDDLASGKITLLSDGKSRNTDPHWSYQGTASPTVPHGGRATTWTSGWSMRPTQRARGWCRKWREAAGLSTTGLAMATSC